MYCFVSFYIDTSDLLLMEPLVKLVSLTVIVFASCRFLSFGMFGSEVSIASDGSFASMALDLDTPSVLDSLSFRKAVAALAFDALVLDALVLDAMASAVLVERGIEESCCLWAERYMFELIGIGSKYCFEDAFLEGRGLTGTTTLVGEKDVLFLLTD